MRISLAGPAGYYVLWVARPGIQGLSAWVTLARQRKAMELDALYCDVIVKRWEEFTGRKAVRQFAVADAAK